MRGAFVSQNNCSPRKDASDSSRLSPPRLAQEPSRRGVPLKRSPGTWALARGGLAQPGGKCQQLPFDKRTCETRRGGRCETPANELRGPPPQSSLLLAHEVEEGDKKKIKSFPDTMPHPLGWREGARTAVISTHVEGNPDCSSYHSAGAHWPLRSDTEPDCKDRHRLSSTRLREGPQDDPAGEDPCSARNPGVHFVLYITYIFKLCGLKCTPLKSPRETER